MEPYVIISADCHAELPTERYREYVDPEYREDFEAYLAEKAAASQVGGFIDEEFAERWFTEHGEGIAGGWDVALRDKELDGDGVVGEVIFPDADAVTGVAGPVRAGWASRATSTPDVPWPGAGPQPLAGRAVQPQPRAAAGSRSCRYLQTSTQRSPRSPAPRSPDCGRDSDPRTLGRLPALPRSPLRQDLGRLPGPADAGAHPLRPARKRSTAATWASTSPKCAGGGPAAVVRVVVGVFERFPGCAGASPSAVRFGPTTCCG
ncbi:hypothetical protein I553_8575 [Mycobacterium xenopi 4042]|uniref:Uncharacterized protein n=1 Tax=Mycobacterium xenopi 4042 TaxID=1299334 RepID=X8CJH3_MYCXE|nr:hypothetical protein I553_8575 [Mycobacterium xenopi 4042]